MQNKAVDDHACSEEEYNQLSAFLRQSCGIELGENKQYLVKNRLSPVLMKYDLASYSNLVEHLNSSLPLSHQIKSAFIDAMTTNETFWFRDRGHFDALRRQVFPALLESKAGSIKVWSAACSTGQEPYSISICADQALASAGKNRNIQIIGTDISESVLKNARHAKYSELAFSRGLELPEREKYFHKIQDGYRLDTEITQRVRFQQFNLLKPFSVLGRFDVIFCRNVLIYFSEDDKRDILKRIWGALEPGGYLFLSSTESLPGGTDQFEVIKDKVRYFKKIS